MSTIKYIKGLDSLRAVAVILVIIWHWYPQDYSIHTFIGGIIHTLLPTGEFGVSLFFVLSGFLITEILLLNKSSEEKNYSIIKNFYIRRALRILPIYYLAIFFVNIIRFPIDGGHYGYILTHTYNFLVIKEGSWPSLGHLWSLSVEEQFYLIWPLLILLIPNNKLKYLFAIFIAISIISVIVSYKILNIKMTYAITTTCFDAFGIGGIYAFCRKSDNMIKFNFYIIRIFPVALAIYFINKLCPFFDVFPNLSPFNRTFDSILSLWLIHKVITNKNSFFMTHFVDNHSLRFIGKISYGLYLFHYPFPFIFDNYILSNLYFIKTIIVNFPVFRELIMFCLLIVLSSITFFLFEKPINSMKKYFS